MLSGAEDTGNKVASESKARGNEDMAVISGCTIVTVAAVVEVEVDGQVPLSLGSLKPQSGRRHHDLKQEINSARATMVPPTFDCQFATIGQLLPPVARLQPVFNTNKTSSSSLFHVSLVSTEQWDPVTFLPTTRRHGWCLCTWLSWALELSSGTRPTS